MFRLKASTHKRPDPLRESRSMPIATQSGGCSRFCTVLPPNRRVPKLHATRVNDRGSQPKKSGNQIVNNMMRSEEHTSELQSLMRISYAVFCLKKKKIK